jgi:hypothetical protein
MAVRLTIPDNIHHIHPCMKEIKGKQQKSVVAWICV